MRKSMINLCYKRLFNVRMVHNLPQRKCVTTSKNEIEEMMALWPSVTRDLTENCNLDFYEVTKRLSKVLQYNVPTGKKTRALDLVYAYKQLAPSDQLTDENLRLARILGWCNEMVQAFFLIEDDIMDNSITRRGKPCWYLHNDIGLTAVNDGILVEQMIFQLLQMNFRQKPYYLDLIETYHENIYKTTVGQTLDLLSTNHGKKPNLNLFTMDRYNAIVKYKTAYCTSVIPVKLAMHLAGIKDKEMFKQPKTLLLEMGNLFQVQDDYLDCFGDPQVTGKVGTDIEEGKCSWLVVVALQRVTSSQRKILEECYGVNDPEKVARVKELYHELELQTVYTAYEEEKYNLINNRIKQISYEIFHDLLFKMLNRIHRRNKSNNVRNTPQNFPNTNEDERRKLMAIWPDVLRDLKESNLILDIPDVIRWLEKVMQYNVPKGKMSRATDLIFAYKQLAPTDQLTDENIRLARILGWCNEMVQAFFLMEDDIMDNSKTRRGQPCWYLNNDIGLAAINDGILIEQMVFRLLRMHFRGKPYYTDLLDTFHENIYLTILGQSLDLLSMNREKKPNLDLFTMERYNAIVKYKTAYYTCVLPVILAMHFAGIKDSEKFRQSTKILLEIGKFFQVQDDYLDCFGDPQVIGKIGTDIQEGKCSWLVVVALERVTPAQRKILEECYGESDLEKVAKVKELYNELGLQTIYSVNEEETYNSINTHIKQMSCGMPLELFFTMLNKFYRRNM